MRILDSRRDFGEVSEVVPQAEVVPAAAEKILAGKGGKTATKPAETIKKTKGEKGEEKEKASSPKKNEDEIDLEDLRENRSQ